MACDIGESETLPEDHSSQEQTGAIDDVHRAVVACDDEIKRNEGKSIVEGLAKLKYELQHDRVLTYVKTEERVSSAAKY